MKDRIIKGNGKSALVKLNMFGINSFDEFKQKAAAGELYADVIANNDGTGTDEVGTPLIKANLLTDQTATALGLTGDPTVDDALRKMGPAVSGAYDLSVVGSDAWTVKKYANGYFEAVFWSNNGDTGPNMTQIGSSGVYLAPAARLRFPEEIGITKVLSVVGSAGASANYIMDWGYNRLTNEDLYYYFLRVGSGSQVTNISWTVRVFGKWA